MIRFDRICLPNLEINTLTERIIFVLESGSLIGAPRDSMASYIPDFAKLSDNYIDHTTKWLTWRRKTSIWLKNRNRKWKMIRLKSSIFWKISAAAMENSKFSATAYTLCRCSSLVYSRLHLFSQLRILNIGECEWNKFELYEHANFVTYYFSFFFQMPDTRMWWCSTSSVWSGMDAKCYTIQKLQVNEMPSLWTDEISECKWSAILRKGCF